LQVKYNPHSASGSVDEPTTLAGAPSAARFSAAGEAPLPPPHLICPRLTGRTPARGQRLSSFPASSSSLRLWYVQAVVCGGRVLPGVVVSFRKNCTLSTTMSCSSSRRSTQISDLLDHPKYMWRFAMLCHVWVRSCWPPSLLTHGCGAAIPGWPLPGPVTASAPPRVSGARTGPPRPRGRPSPSTARTAPRQTCLHRCGHPPSP
jgi:hypothetical protein